MPWWMKLIYRYKLKYRADLNKVCIDVDMQQAMHFVFVKDIDEVDYPSVQEFLDSMR